MPENSQILSEVSPINRAAVKSRLLVVGNEGEGLSSSIIQKCNMFESIAPGRTLHPCVDSLNVSVATALLMERLLQKTWQSPLNSSCKMLTLRRWKQKLTGRVKILHHIKVQTAWKHTAWEETSPLHWFTKRFFRDCYILISPNPFFAPKVGQK